MKTFFFQVQTTKITYTINKCSECLYVATLKHGVLVP